MDPSLFLIHDIPTFTRQVSFNPMVLMVFILLVLGYGLVSRRLERTVITAPILFTLAGSGLSRSTVLFMGWFGPRGLASIVLGLVYLEHELNLPGEHTIRLAVIATVLLSIFAHGLSAMPGIAWHAGRSNVCGDDAK